MGRGDAQCPYWRSGIRQGVWSFAVRLLIEPVIAPGNEPSFAKLLDLFMLVWPGGRERTASEHCSLLADAGLELRRGVTTTSALSILGCRSPPMSDRSILIPCGTPILADDNANE